MSRSTLLLLAFGLVSCKDAPTAPPVATSLAKLAFTVQPSDTTAGAAINPAVTVTVQDGVGNTVTTATTRITLAIGTNPGGGTLAGATTATAVNGVVSFADLSINNRGTGYTLTASASGLSGATSDLFNVTDRILAMSGVWDWTERIEDLSDQHVCSDTGSYTFAQQGGTFVGLSEQVGTCRGPQGTHPNNVTDSVRAGNASEPEISFVAGSGSNICRYAAPFPSGSPDTLSGTVACGTASGTWRAVRGGDLGSVTVTPSSARALAGGRAQFRAELRTKSGDRAFGRAVTWSSSNAAVATVAQNGLVTAAASGTVAITAIAGGTSGSASLTVPPPLTLTAVAAGILHTCALDASGEAYCWGLNNSGPLGDGSTSRSGVPVPVVGGLTFTGISAGWTHTCGLATGGAAYCWGWNFYGQLGDGSITDRTTPVPVAGGLTFVALSAASLHTCGLRSTGEAYCWGWNGLGQLGDSSTIDRVTPVLVAGGHRFQSLSAGGLHTCGIVANGTAYCWGNNFNGELGNDSQGIAGPVLVAGGRAFSSVSAGYYHTCGVTTDGEAYCWGWNGFGQLGNGSMTGGTTLVSVAGGLKFTAVSAGTFHSCGITTTGAAWCWGRNGSGELGDNSRNSSATPVAVAGGLTFVSLSAAGFQFYDEPDDLVTDRTCGITTGQVAYCWGDDQYGLLGTGSGGGYTPPAGPWSLVPVKVAGQR